MNDILTRISEMENIHDRCRDAVDRLLDALKEYSHIKPDLKRLEEYYQSPLWLEDYNADCGGDIPREVKRGVLAEDTIYDLLTDEHGMIQIMKELAEK